MTEIKETLEERCKRLVDREIHANQTYLVNDMFAAAPYIGKGCDVVFPDWYDDVKNFSPRQDIDDLIRYNLDEFVDWLLDSDYDHILKLSYSAEFGEFRKQVTMGLLKAEDMDDPDDVSAFWSWLQDHQPATEDGEAIRRRLLLNINLIQEEQNHLYEWFQDHGVEIEDEGHEVFSWYLVSDWLAEKLEAKGAVILRWANQVWWGRCTFGQLIMYDGVIMEIVKELYADAETTD